MDLGCLDLGCMEKQRKETFLDSGNNAGESVMSASKVGKNKGLKEAGQSNGTALKKFTSQVKKPPHRKTSPLNWFPRKKVDSYLKRKIKLLQEVGGMNSTLDETLGDSNLHYSKVLREKIAVREAAHKAMEARKAAMVEASWCRILRAARIDSKEAEALLLKAEKSAAEAFEAATSSGVILYDVPDCSEKHYEIKMSSTDGGGSTTHTVKASFETAFEVDKQVATAVKTAFIRLANCSSMNRDEFKELLRKISENPDTDENTQDISEFSSDCESDTGSELESGSYKDGFSSANLNPEMDGSKSKYKKRQVSEKFNLTKLVDMMLERLKHLQEDELASLATIVATCGLNAALAEAEISKQLDLGSAADYTSVSSGNISRRMSSFGAGTARNSNVEGQMRRNHIEAEIPSLDKFLVKRLTRLEREVQDAKNARNNEARERTDEKPDKSDDEKACLGDTMSLSDTDQDLGSILMKHSSKFEKEIAEAKKNSGQLFEKDHKKSQISCNGGMGHTNQDVSEVPSLDKFLVKNVSKLEKEVQEAKNRRRIELIEGGKVNDLSKKTSLITSDRGRIEKENIDLNMNVEFHGKQKEVTPTLPLQNTRDSSGESLIGNDEGNDAENSLDKILLKPVHRLEREKMLAKSSSDFENLQSRKKPGGNRVAWNGSLDEVMVKHVSRLEKEKMELGTKEEVVMKVKRRDANIQLEKSEGSLDQVLVKHKSRLEREKMNAAQQPDDRVKHSVALREARQRELQEAWGGLSLGNSIRPHISRLERDKAAWVKAEEEERRRAVEEV
ncbi:unnamed protein product [Ilex paraguariensis]|uniref:Uncharacterized protein n=1 Tax=Ilex paraguariensis TaxID=185542 RepID=A0ABC8UJD7_9AQUA